MKGDNNLNNGNPYGYNPNMNPNMNMPMFPGANKPGYMDDNMLEQRLMNLEERVTRLEKKLMNADDNTNLYDYQSTMHMM